MADASIVKPVDIAARPFTSLAVGLIYSWHDSTPAELWEQAASRNRDLQVSLHYERELVQQHSSEFTKRQIALTR